MELPTDAAGNRLVEALSRPNDPYNVTVLIVEAGRVAHRLEKLDMLLSGDVEVWVGIQERRGEVPELRIDNALQEARQQATVLRQLLAEIRRIRADDPNNSDDDDPLDDL